MTFGTDEVGMNGWAFGSMLDELLCARPEETFGEERSARELGPWQQTALRVVKALQSAMTTADRVNNATSLAYYVMEAVHHTLTIAKRVNANALLGSFSIADTIVWNGNATEKIVVSLEEARKEIDTDDAVALAQWDEVAQIVCNNLLSGVDWQMNRPAKRYLGAYIETNLGKVSMS